MQGIAAQDCTPAFMGSSVPTLEPSFEVGRSLFFPGATIFLMHNAARGSRLFVPFLLLTFYLFFLLGGNWGCASLSGEGQPFPPAEGVRLKGKLEIAHPAGRQKGAVAVLSDGRARVRAEFLSHLGGVVALLWIERETWLFWDPGERLALQGTISEVLSSLPLLPPLYRDALLLTLGFLSLTKAPPFVTLRKRWIPDDTLTRAGFPLPLPEGERLTLPLSPTGVTLEKRGEDSYSLHDGPWTLELSALELETVPLTREVVRLLEPRLPSGTSLRSFGELFSSSPQPVPQRRSPGGTPPHEPLKGQDRSREAPGSSAPLPMPPP